MKKYSHKGLSNTESIQLQAKQNITSIIQTLRNEDKISHTTCGEILSLLDEAAVDWMTILLERMTDTESYVFEVERRGVTKTLKISIT